MNAAAELSPLSSQRIRTELLRRGYRFKTEPDGDITGIWDGNRFWFSLLGEKREVLRVRGKWSTDLPGDSFDAALFAANDWNRDRVFPKVYVRDEGTVGLYTEVSVDFEPGATDEQIADVITCGLITAAQFFAQADTIALDFE